MSADNASLGRRDFSFVGAVKKAFDFLPDLGFVEIETAPTRVRYRRGDIEIDLYHGRGSFEIGFEIVRHDTRYPLSELIGAVDAEAAAVYRNYAATSPGAVVDGLERLAELVRRYCVRALSGDAELFATADENRRNWASRYALEVLASQIRPQAAAAFRRRNYREATELYERIRPLLNSTELKKLDIARSRAKL